MRPNSKNYEKMMPYYAGAVYVLIALGLIFTGEAILLGIFMLVLAVLFLIKKVLK